MERFKALEKEMKMKAFSKEGLIAQSRLDPAEKAKRDMIDWIGNTTDELSRQIEQTEAEAEQLQTGKKKKTTGDRLGELETLNERRTWHIGRLEIVQRMLENGQLQMELVETIQEDVKYFVEANTVSLTPQWMLQSADTRMQEEDFDYDAGIYDDLNLQDEEDFTQEFLHNDDVSNLDSESVTDPSDAPKTPAKEEREKKLTPTSKTVVTPLDEQPPSPVAKKQPLRKPTMEGKPEPVSAAAPAPPVAPSKLPPKPVEPTPIAVAPPPKPAALPPIRYAAAAAAAVAGSQSTATVPTVPIPAPAPTVPASLPSPVEAIASPAKPKKEPSLPPAPAEAPVSEEKQSPIPASESPLAVSPSPRPAQSPLPQVNVSSPLILAESSVEYLLGSRAPATSWHTSLTITCTSILFTGSCRPIHVASNRQRDLPSRSCWLFAPTAWLCTSRGELPRRICLFWPKPKTTSRRTRKPHAKLRCGEGAL